MAGRKRSEMDRGPGKKCGLKRGDKMRVQAEITPGDFFIDEDGMIWIPWLPVDIAPREIFADKKKAARAATRAAITLKLVK